MRAGEVFVPGPDTTLRAGDHALVATSREARSAVEERLRAGSRGGRLAGWYDDVTAPRAATATRR